MWDQLFLQNKAERWIASDVTDKMNKASGRVSLKQRVLKWIIWAVYDALLKVERHFCEVHFHWLIKVFIQKNEEECK